MTPPLARCSVALARSARGLALALPLAAAVAGCPAISSDETELFTPDESEGDVAEARAAVVSSNGTELNGHSLNGHKLNGHKLNGQSLNGRSLVGISFDGGHLGTAQFKSLKLDGSALEAKIQGNKLRGAELAGAELRGLLDDGSVLRVRIDGAREPARGADVSSYEVSYLTDDAGWTPLCGTDAGAEIAAIPLAGRWDAREGVAGGGSKIEDDGAFTLACEGFALAKCVELGYEPWQKVKSCAQGGCPKVSLSDHHQACTRMLRADFCGDGTPHTVDGTLINLYDAVGLQADSESWSFEAEWTAAGARCVKRQRVIAGTAPACFGALSTTDCGSLSHFATGTLLMSEDAPSP